MLWRIEIRHKKGVFDSLGEGVYKSILDLGIRQVSGVEVRYIYNIEGPFDRHAIEKISQELLVDKITQTFQCTNYTSVKKSQKPTDKDVHTIEIAYNPGVMDPVEHSTIKGIHDLGFPEVGAVSTAKEYLIFGRLNSKERTLIIDKVLANKLIQHVVDPVGILSRKKLSAEKDVNVRQIDLIDASDKKLMQLSRDGQLFLNLQEMKNIQEYFRALKRNPTDCELETVAQTWSEHCYHKTFRGNIEYQYTEDGETKTKNIRSLLKSTIVKATTQINKPWCVSVFHDNAGVIEFDSETNVCFKVETHNHPSALEPFGGANTGIGGVIRDILGTGLGAKPVCSTDVFCFASPEMSFDNLPAGTLHPKRVMKGVVSGVRDYGNKIGIPTVNGAILFDEHFVGNPLVYCGNVGLMPKDKVFKKVNKGDLIVAVGGKTGRDGIHGATFSSGELTSESEVVSSGAVQIGDPIQEKKVADALLQARDLNLYSAITDCGAGGFSSAVGEMGSELGARVDLDKAPLKYAGLNYEEIWISESQERMVLSVPKKNIKKLLSVFENENVEATVIGEFDGSGHLRLFYNGIKVCDLDMEFLHEGNVRVTKKAKWAAPKTRDPKIPEKKNLNEPLIEILSHYNVCSKEWVIRQYDHEVQGGSIIKPLVGAQRDGPSDASVVAPRPGSYRGIAISNGINVRFGKIDPFWMSASCIDEAVRQIVAVGGDVDRIAILDNFCWGNPDKPDRLGSLVRAALGCYKASVGFQVPFISGKDSLYNEYTQDEKSIAIPGTILISAIGVVEDVRQTVTMDFKKPGNLVYCIGKTFDEIGGSIYLDNLKALGHSVPHVNMNKARRTYQKIYQCVQKGLIRSMHDCSEGGIGAALAEMAFSGNLGLTARLDKVPYEGQAKRNDYVLFSESNSRLIVEVDPKDQADFESSLKGTSFGLIGKVEETSEFIIYGLDKDVCVNVFIQALKEAWQKPLRW